MPPNPQTKLGNNATLLASWWSTGFSLVIIVVRICGRYIRSEELFTEDRMMLVSIVPLLIRMGFVHVILIWGTNNTKTAGLSDLEIQHREIGSGLVLAARIFYALFIWTAKFTVCLFLKRLLSTISVLRKSTQVMMHFIQYFLATTLVAVVLATLTECQPFDHYWQVIPDPGPRCRLGYANLITMGVCDIITDIFLVAIPIPLVIASAMRLKKKVSLVCFFAFSMILVAITCYRVPSVIQRNGLQGYRSLLASLEILAATAVSNAVVIGSFVRDRGVKKQKFKKAYGSASVSESLERSSVRRNITYHQWGSDADLAGDVGFRLEPDLQSTDSKIVRPAPVAAIDRDFTAQTGALDRDWTFNKHRQSALSAGTEDDRTSAGESIGEEHVYSHEYLQSQGLDYLPRISGALDGTSSASPRKVSFFDVGGLLGPSSPGESKPPLTTWPSRPADFAPSADRPDPQQYRRGSRALLQDVGGLLSSPSGDSSSPPTARNYSRLQPPYSTGDNLSVPTYWPDPEEGGPSR